jgi:hypothetical protein
MLNPRKSASTMRGRTTVRRRGGRAVECTGLENQQGLIALRGFKSHPLRHFSRKPVDNTGRWQQTRAQASDELKRVMLAIM